MEATSTAINLSRAFYSSSSTSLSRQLHVCAGTLQGAFNTHCRTTSSTPLCVDCCVMLCTYYSLCRSMFPYSLALEQTKLPVHFQITPLPETRRVITTAPIPAHKTNGQSGLHFFTFEYRRCPAVSRRNCMQTTQDKRPSTVRRYCTSLHVRSE